MASNQNWTSYDGHIKLQRLQSNAATPRIWPLIACKGDRSDNPCEVFAMEISMTN